MYSLSYGTPFPTTAYRLSMAGGVVIAVFGVLEVALGVAYRHTLESLVPGSSARVVLVGVLGVVIGGLIVVFALRLRSTPATANTSGIVIIVLSVLSYFGGSGLFIGLLIALIGGVLAATWRPPAFPQPMYGSPDYGLIRNEPIPAVPGPVSPPPGAMGAPQRFCSFCGTPNLASARYCAKCGAPMGS